MKIIDAVPIRTDTAMNMFGAYRMPYHLSGS